jgi:hypothetical protein
MNPLQAGIAAAREGRRAEARALLMRALQTNSRSEQAWLWMSAVVETDTERQSCLEQVLAINPHNQTAQLGLEKIKAGNSSEGPQPGYLPISRPDTPPSTSQYRAQYSDRPAPPPSSANPPAGSLSPHSLPTLGLSPIESGAGRIRRLDPQPTPADGLALLRSIQSQSQPAPAPTRSPAPSAPGSLAAVILIGGLSVTAIAGLLMLIFLWLIGWPPA